MPSDGSNDAPDGSGGGLIFDPRARSVQRGTQAPVALRAKSFAAFEALAKAYPDPLSKDALIEAVWGQAAVSDDSVTQCIADIRRTLSDREHHVVQTVPGTGYRLMIAARSVDAPDPRDTPVDIQVSTTPAIKRRGSLTRLIAVGAICGAVAVGLWMAWAQFSPATQVSDRPAVAVVAFEPLSADASMATMARALPSDILVALGELDTVSVLSPSVLTANESTRASQSAAYTAKGAQYLVSGTLQRGPARLRISAHLTDTASGQVVWVQRWQRDPEDLIAVQDEVVQAVVAELANPWSGRIGALQVGQGDTLTAQDRIRLGAAAFQLFTPASLAEAVTHFTAATQQDPNNPEGWSGLAFAQGALMAMAPPDQIQDLQQARAENGRTAFHLDKSNGRALLAGSWTAALRGTRRPQTLERLRGAVAAAGGDADLLAMASFQGALTTQLYGEAYGWGQTALSLKDAPPAWYHLGPGLNAYFNGDLDTALSHLQAAPQGHALVLAVLTAAQSQNDTDAAAATHARLRMLHHDFTITHLMAAELFYPQEKATALRSALTKAGLRME